MIGFYILSNKDFIVRVETGLRPVSTLRFRQSYLGKNK